MRSVAGHGVAQSQRSVLSKKVTFVTGRPGEVQRRTQEQTEPYVLIAGTPPRTRHCLTPPPRPPPMGTPVWGPRRAIWEVGSSLHPLLSGKDGVHACDCLMDLSKRLGMGAVWPLFHKPQTQERQGREKVPSVKTSHGCLQGRWRNQPAGSTGEPLTAAAGGTGAQRGFPWRPRWRRGGGWAKVPPTLVQAPAPGQCTGAGQVPPQVRAGSERHLLDCSVARRTTEVKAPRPCGSAGPGERRTRVRFQVIHHEGRGLEWAVPATWGRGEERDPDGERDRQTDRQTSGREIDTDPQRMEMEQKREVENLVRDGAKRRRKIFST